MKKTDFNQVLENYLRMLLSQIGPETAFKRDDLNEIYSFEDGLKLNSKYVYGCSFLKEFLIPKPIKNKINYSTVYNISDNLIKSIYHQIKSRKQKISNTLDKYLNKEDIDFAARQLNKTFDNCFGKHKIIWITDLIQLKDVENFNIGNVTFSKINADLLTLIPENSDPQSYSSFYGLTNDNLSKKDKVKSNEKKTALIVEVQGYHYHDETSQVFENALLEFQQALAFLYYAEHFFNNVKNKDFSLKKKQKKRIINFDAMLTPASSDDKFYIKKQNSIDKYKYISTRFSNISFPEEGFILDQETLTRLKQSCYLEKFNILIKNEEKCEIANKLTNAFHWFYKSLMDKNSLDQAISLFISLESLLSLGADPFRGSTDDLAENVAILYTSDPNDRYLHKEKFKKLYSVRCKIVHGGEKFDDNIDEIFQTISRLKGYVVWSILGFFYRLDDIFKIGKKAKHLKEFFDKEKLKGGGSLADFFKKK